MWCVLAAAALAGCTGSGFGLRGVGAPEQQPGFASSSTLPGDQTPLIVTSDPNGSPEALPLTAVTSTPTTRSPRIAVIPPEPAMGASREAALRDIRAKAAATGEEPPDVFDIPVSTTMPADEEETERTTRELEAAAAGNKGVVSDEELKRRKKSLEWLRRRARSHYDDALSLIEK